MTSTPSPKPFRPYRLHPIHSIGDYGALVLMAIILIICFADRGLINYGVMRGVVFSGCGVLGLWALTGWLLGRFDGERMAAARAAVAVMFTAVLLFGFQLIPLPASIVFSLSSAVGESWLLLNNQGVSVPPYLPLAHSPVRAFMSWHQLVASLCFFSCALLLASRRRTAILLLTMIIVAGFVETGFSYFQIITEKSLRVSGAVFNPNHHAALLLISMTVGAGFFLRWQRDRFGSQWAFLRGTNPGSLLILILLAMIAVWAGSLSRASLFLGFVTAVVLLIAEFRRNESAMTGSIRNIAIMSSIGLMSFIALIVLISPVLQTSLFIDRLEERLSSQDNAVIDYGRIEMSRATLAGLMESPVTGLGLGGTSHAINRFETTDSTRKAIWSHNEYVQVVAEMGVVPFLIFLGILLWFGIRSRIYWQRWKISFNRSERDLYGYLFTAFSIVMIHALVDFHLRIPLIGFVALIVLALCLTPGAGFISAYKKNSDR